MSRFYRAASFAATSFCAFAAIGGFGTGNALGAISTPVPVITEPLPAVPEIVLAPSDGIVLPPATSQSLPAADMPSGAGLSLAQLVSMHAHTSDAGQDMNCLATAVYFESKGEPLAGQLAVAQVIMNRAASGRFASSICGVVRQPSQFSFFRGGAMPTPREGAQWQQAVGIAHVALNRLYSQQVGDALYFHARRVSPNWGKKRVASFGNHIFYR